ncbi:ketoacyl-ACP synthase III [Escherichia albertii]|uniref:3-oxoacyl-[acyl-carrier-protein] synthase III C-terminal domain-containing protein n=1 Tax=Escherichia albertii TaxID=208962 RepID=UPI001375249C|nr:3-oxoacyl-[acyl-carrier-protein] synthase III C-terminal domain-containing protein [Escherichia albertii]
MDLPNRPTISTALKIIATGIALPPDKITSQQLDVRLNKPAGYVERRSGICWRYFASNDASQAELAADALHNALSAAALNPGDIDLLICASAIAVQALPCSAIHILKAAKMPAGVAGFDINSSCVSFISALEVAAGLLNCGAYRRIAIVSADISSRGIDWNHEESSLIFGDGAACAIVEQGNGRCGIIASLIEMYPEGSELCEIRAGGTRCNPRSGVSDSDFLFHMQGKPLFRFASSLIEDYFSRLLQKSSLQLADIGTVVPHQTSHLSLEHMRKRLRVPESALIDVYRFYGNQVAASIPTALHEAVISGRFTADKPAMLIGTAAGLTLAGMVLLP